MNPLNPLILQTSSPRQETESSKKEKCEHKAGVQGDLVTQDNFTNYTKVPSIDVCQ